MATWTAERPPSRLASGLVATSSLLLNVGTGFALFRYRLELLDGEEGEAGGLLCLAVAQACTIGAVVALVRFFARASLVDLAGTLVLLLSTLLLTFTPSLSGPFSELLCRELTRGELFRVTSEREGRAGGTSEGWGLRGVDVVVWGIETCEENWRTGAILVVALVLSLVVFKTWGIWATWEFHAKLQGLPNAASDPEWCEDKAPTSNNASSSLKPSRTRALSFSKPTRSRSTPTAPEGRPHTHGRFKSHSVSHRPRLVLVPVFFDATAPRTISPSSYEPPTTPTHNLLPSAATTSTKSTSPTRSPRHPRARGNSAPSQPSPPPMYPLPLPSSPPLHSMINNPPADDTDQSYLTDSSGGGRRARARAASGDGRHEKQV
ncbi:hypothetical protein RQP46_005388 [Phenoliferia psychrophenolica]